MTNQNNVQEITVTDNITKKKVNINVDNIIHITFPEKDGVHHKQGGRTWFKFTRSNGHVTTCCATETLGEIKCLAKWEKIPSHIKLLKIY